MGRAVRINLAELEILKKNLEDIQKNQDEIMASLVKSLGALLLRKVIFRTPVGDYSYLTHISKKVNEKWERVPVGKKQGGNLRRNWTVGKVFKNGTLYSVEVINPTFYASYVEYGHRQTSGRFVAVLGKKLKRAWVPGRFMLTISENEIRDNLDVILEKKLDKILKKVFGNVK